MALNHDVRYGFPEKELQATDKVLIQDKDMVIHRLKGEGAILEAIVFDELPVRNTPQTGDTILAVDEDGNLFRIPPVNMATITVGDFDYNFVNGILVGIVDNS
jgi:hypothetical protein